MAQETPQEVLLQLENQKDVFYSPIKRSERIKVSKIRIISIVHDFLFESFRCYVHPFVCILILYSTFCSIPVLQFLKIMSFSALLVEGCTPSKEIHTRFGNLFLAKYVSYFFLFHQ